MQRDLFEPLLDYYVTMRKAAPGGKTRTAFLAGPFPTHAAALALVDRAGEVAYEIDPWTHFYERGTASLPKHPDNPRGRLNERLGVCTPA